MFTDKSLFRVYNVGGDIVCDANIAQRVVHGGGGVMVWAVFAHRHRTPLHFFDENF
jgi:hypothetical protein